MKQQGTINAVSDGASLIITLSAPHKLNALSLSMREMLREILRDGQANRKIRGIIIAGAEGNFSSGGDVSQMLDLPTPQVARERLVVLHDIIRLIMGGNKPVVAAVEGVAYGAGLSIAAACDHVIVSETSKFSAAFGRLGLVADCGLFWTLPQRVGLGRARDILLTGAPFDANEALDWGVADTLVGEGQALVAAQKKVEQYVPIGPLAIAATKSALVRRPNSLEDALAMEADLQDFLRNTQDHADACEAFLNKKPMVFKGR